MVRFIKILFLLFTGTRAAASALSSPTGSLKRDQNDLMSASRLMARAARRSGGEASRSEVYTSPNVLRILRVLPKDLFEYMFPRANEDRGTAEPYGSYTYYNFLKAASMWPRFCDESDAGSGDLDMLCKRELASMFAHFAQEVGEHNHGSEYELWRQGLYHLTEMGCSDDPSQSGCEYTGGSCDCGTWQGEIWKCPVGVKYFGRGAKQLSYNFNYAPFSYAVFGDVNTLLQAPWRVVARDKEDGWLAFASAFWFYMTPQSPKPSMHDVVTGIWTPSPGDISGGRLGGFGVLIMIINGGIECGNSLSSQQAINRAVYYENFLSAFDLPEEDPSTMTCANMHQFDASTSSFVPSYWDRDWVTDKSCKLVPYQTGFSIFDDPLDPEVPYEKCVKHFFGTSRL